MEDKPSLIIKSTNNTLIIIAKYIHEISEHEILIYLVLGYYWQNNLPFFEKFMELIETVIKRAVNQVLPHKKLYLKYVVESNDNFEESSIFNIEILQVKADDTEIELVGKIINLEGIDNRGSFSKITSFRRKKHEIFEKEIF